MSNAPANFLFPPFEAHADTINAATNATQRDFEQAISSDQATQIPRPFPAHAGHLLWVNQDFSVHYGPAGDVQTGLRSFAKEAAKRAKDAFRMGKYEDALRLSQFAINADDRCLDAVLTKGLIYQTVGDVKKVKLLADVADAINPDVDFQSWLDLYAAKVDATLFLKLATRFRVVCFKARVLAKKLRPDHWFPTRASNKTEGYALMSQFVLEALSEARKTARRNIPTI
ncbi:MAG: hypothetical protein L0Z50_07825 [Verrucomicrobiales bacterium]|nr:hypothetical protein [Verrucomicrobiales bacterium]